MGIQKKFVAKNGIQTFQPVLVGTDTDNEIDILQVEGGLGTDDLNITGAIFVNGSTGSAGQVLKSDGTNTFWSTEVGFTGSKGDTGDQGPIGFTGSQGIQGSIGFTGSRGIKGFTGSQGIQGDIGFTGSQGIQGPIGFTGSQGIQGEQGPIGFTGSQGESGLIDWERKTSNYTAQDKDGIIADTSGGSFTITLPENPLLGEYIVIVDGGDWSINPLTVARNGSTIEGIADDLSLDVEDVRVDFIYDGSTWQVYANVGRQGEQGPIGFTGSRGPIGFTGSMPSDFVAASTGGTFEGDVVFASSGHITVPNGTDAQRPSSPESGMFRFNTTQAEFEGYNGSEWGSIGGGSELSDDTSTNETRYVTFVSDTTGSADELFVSSTKLFFNPSTGTLNATEFNSLSDETFKSDLRKIENPLELMRDIEGISFKWKDSKKKSLGISAQKLEKILPELVSNDKFKTVNYNGLIAIIIEAIKELDNRIK